MKYPVAETLKRRIPLLDYVKGILSRVLREQPREAPKHSPLARAIAGTLAAQKDLGACVQCSAHSGR